MRQTHSSLHKLFDNAMGLFVKGEDNLLRKRNPTMKQPPSSAFRIRDAKQKSHKKLDTMSLQRKVFVFLTIAVMLMTVTMMSRQTNSPSKDSSLMTTTTTTTSLRIEPNEKDEKKPVVVDYCTEWREKFPKYETSKESSFFNCDSPDGKCQYFYPSRFFDTQCGIGKNFYSLIEKTKELYDTGTLWLNMPYIPLPHIKITSTTNQTNDVTKLPFQTKNITFIHVHKTGGTSLVSAYSQSMSKYKFNGRRNIIYNPSLVEREKAMPKDMGNETRKGKHWENVRTYQTNKRVSSKILDGGVIFQDEWGPNDMMITAIVRDPIDRFVSAVGQAMGATGSVRNKISFKTICTKEEIEETLLCAINYIKANGTFFELHFTPMALELSFATMYKDVPVAIFPFEAVPQYLNELGIAKKKLKDGSRSRLKYLRGMNSSHLDENMIQSVCSIYNVDVIMMRSLGWEVPRCDKYLPKLENETLQFRF